MPTVAAYARRARWAVFIVFVLNGFVFANWAGRLPTVRDMLHRNEEQMGALLFMIAIGSVLALPLTGHVVDRIGASKTVLIGSTLVAVGFTVVSIGLVNEALPLVVVGLFLDGMGTATWDVAMNLEGTVVERRLGRAIMPQFHAGYSFGTVGGAGVALVMERFDVPVPPHLIVVAAGALVFVMVSVRFFLPRSLGTAAEQAAPSTQPAAVPEAAGGAAMPQGKAASDVANQPIRSATRHSRARRLFGAWLEPRTVLIGFMVLAAALTEGAANDWVALAVVDGFDVPNYVGTVGLAVFLTAMTCMRLLGTRALDRHGRVTVLRLSSGCAIVGLAVFGLAPWLWLALLGIVLWGIGAALGFPVGMSAAADDPLRAAARVSVVSTIGYCAFLAGPPTLGYIAHLVGYRHALLFIQVPLIISFFLIPFAAPLKGMASRAPLTKDAETSGTTLER